MSLSVSLMQLGGAERFPEAPCLFVEASDSVLAEGGFIAPACPLVAVGTALGQAAKLADLVVPDAKAAEQVLGAIACNPRTAAVIVDLLRVLPALPLEQGLVAESFAYGLLQGSGEHAGWLAAQSELARSSEPEGTVRLERNGDELAIRMDRPWADNAIDRRMRDGLADAFELASLDPTITRAVLTGEGRSFSLGADLVEFGTTRDPAEAHHIRRRSLPAIWAARCADKLEARVQGACVGAGLELAAFARRVVAGPRAWFQLPEMAMGLLPGAGGCVSLTHRIGRQRTAELILTGKRLSARTALEWGLVDALVDDFSADDGGADVG